MGARARAELIADRGSAAQSDDFFRSRPFLDAEGVTHSLRVVSRERTATMPVIVRPIEGSGLLDAISPYGYPGSVVAGDGPAPDRGKVDWGGTGLVSVFARERLAGAAWLAGADETARVLVYDPARPRAVRGRLAEQARANSRAGWAVDVRPGGEARPADRDAFALAYAETMRRTAAAERYLFDRGYLDAVLSYERAWLLVARSAGEPGAAAIAVTSDSMLHYYLGGTADGALEASPFKNVVVAMLDLADELGMALNLGGGVTPGDGLERFKRGFANSDLPWFAHRVVCDAQEYERLAPSGDPGGFFPAYRAP